MTERQHGLSVRLKLALTLASVALVGGMAVLLIVWLFLLRYVPDEQLSYLNNMHGVWAPNRGDLEVAFLPRALIALALTTIAGLICGWFLAGRMLRPLDEISAAVEKARSGSLSHRVNMAGRSDELRTLADAVDTMLESVEDQVDEQARFAANASHELRTPLAATQAVLEVAAHHPELNTAQVLAKLESLNSRATRSVESLLLLARIDKQPLTMARVDLSLAVEEALETEYALASQQKCTIAAHPSPVFVHGDIALLTHLVTNLVRNAIVHGGANAEVSLETTATPDGWVSLTVENSGAVIADEIIETLTEPFVRGNARTRTGDGPSGSGLGLAIVQSIVRAHEGTLMLTPRASGGLRVVVRLPEPA